LPDAPDDIPLLKVDNSEVLRQQLAKLAQLKAERDPAEVERRLTALTNGAARGGNLLALSVDAARAKATVGEISLAMEKVFKRHEAKPKLLTGVYAAEAGSGGSISRARMMVAAFREADGRPPTILVAKMGQDGHDRGQKVISSGFGDLGFEVDVGPLFATPAETARRAVAQKVHVVGASSLAAGHMTLVPELQAELKKLGREDIMIVVGGVIPPDDVEALKAAGARLVFPPGAVVADAAIAVLEALNEQLGYTQGEAA